MRLAEIVLAAVLVRRHVSRSLPSGVGPAVAWPTAKPRRSSEVPQRQRRGSRFSRRSRGSLHPTPTPSKLDNDIPQGLDVNLVCDNHAIHKTSAIRKWFVADRRFHIYFTPDVLVVATPGQAMVCPAHREATPPRHPRHVAALEETSATGSIPGTKTRDRLREPKSPTTCPRPTHRMSTSYSWRRTLVRGCRTTTRRERAVVGTADSESMNRALSQQSRDSIPAHQEK